MSETIANQTFRRMDESTQGQWSVIVTETIEAQALVAERIGARR